MSYSIYVQTIYMQIQVFWPMTPRQFVSRYRRFGGACCLPVHDTVIEVQVVLD